MSFLIITACTDRKRHVAPICLQARSLPTGTLDQVSCDWTQRVTRAKPSDIAQDLYCGRAFREALVATDRLDGELWIVSAGLGLIPSTHEVPSYNLTTTPRSANSVRSKIIDNSWCAGTWWKALTHEYAGSQTLNELFRKNPNKKVLIAVSKPYAELIRDELEALPDRHLCRLRLFGLRLRSVLSARLHACVMPYERRLDGPDSPIPGTLSDFAQRALRHFAEFVEGGEVGQAGLSDDAARVAQILGSWRLPHATRRMQKSDQAIYDLIETLWDQLAGRSGRMLRHLRDELNIACEQGRFRRLFHEVGKSRKATGGKLL